MQKVKILVVEDEADVRELMLLRLRREGYDVVGIDNGEEAWNFIENSRFDLVILDWMLPGQSGLDLCQKLTGRLPILMVTARADAADVVLGLEMGADDYITKPFEISVFLARVRTLLRRRAFTQSANGLQSGIDADRLSVGDLAVDLNAHEVKIQSKEVVLTTSEFKLLAALMKNQGRVLSRQKLIELVQGEGIMVIDRAIDTHIFGLRKKLGDSADLIETIRGVGYRIKIL